MNNDEHGLSRSDLRKAARREQILNGAVKVFAEKGFKRATTRDIAEAANVSEGTIYNYFENKDALLIELLNDLSQSAAREETFAAGLEMDFREFFKMLIKTRIDFLHSRYDVFLAILPEVLQNPELRGKYYVGFLKPAFDVLENHVNERIRRGQSREMDVPLSARLYSGMAMGIQMMLILGDEEMRAAWDDRDRIVDAITDLFFDGLGAERGETSTGDETSTGGATSTD